MKSNTAVAYSAKTHEGGRANPHQTPLEELKRAVSTCLLFESTFYEKGNEIAARIADLCTQVSSVAVAALAIQARRDMKLRHVPLFLLVQLIKKGGPMVKTTIEEVVQRPDEMGELLSLYWKDGKKPLAAQLKKGLARAFRKFTPYQLAKWDRDAAIKLTDVMFLVHPKPKDHNQRITFKQLVDETLPPADTWETALSAGKDKKATWSRLLEEGKLGYMALLKNLRNMAQVGVEQDLVEQALLAGAPTSKALPFRFVSAYQHAPQYAQALSDAMELAVQGELPGKTVLLLDVSDSMNDTLSGKSELRRYEAAGALAVLVRGMSKRCRIFAYNTGYCEIPNIKGLALIDAIRDKVGGGTNTAAAVRQVNYVCKDMDRLILLTDEQSSDGLGEANAKYAYIINVAPYKPGLELGQSWTRINGWSERAIEWMLQEEANDVGAK